MDENESQHYFEKNDDLNFKEYKPAEKKIMKCLEVQEK